MYASDYRTGKRLASPWLALLLMSVVFVFACSPPTESVQPMLNIDLQEGFESDVVQISINGAVQYTNESVSTDSRIGFADSMTLPFPDGPVTIEVTCASKNLHGSTIIDHSDTVYVAVSIVEESVEFRIADRPFGYL